MLEHAFFALTHVARRKLPPGVYLVRVPTRRGRSLVVAKADLQPGERWITLHPHGKDSDEYVRVLIRVNKDGTGHVISGSDSLRGLKLTRLQPEKWEQSAKERRAAREERRKREEADRKAQERADLERASKDSEFARELAQRKVEKERLAKEKGEALQRLHKELLHKRLEQVALAAELGLPGWEEMDAKALRDPEKLKSEKVQAALRQLGIDPELLSEDPNLKAAVKGGAGMVVGRMRRKLTQGLKRLERDMIKELAENHELRARVYGDGGEVDAAEALDTRLKGGLGYARRVRQQAEEAGVTEEDARAKARRVAEERLERLESIDPERAEHARNAREVMQNMHGVAGALANMGEGSGPKLETDIDPVKVREHAERVKAFLKAAQEAKRLEQQMRQYAGDTEEIAQMVQNRSPGAFDVEVSLDDEAFVSELKQSVEEAAKLDLTRSFFDELQADDVGIGFNEAQRAMVGKVAHAAYAHLNGALLSVLGHSGLDRQVIDTLGLEAAAQLTAWRLQESLSPDELAAVKAGLERYHDTTSLSTMHSAIETAQQAKALALEIDLPAISDAASLVAAKELNAQRKHYLEVALQELGTALGSLEAGAALNLALSRGASDRLTVTFSPEANTEQIVLGLHALGLDESDYRLERTVEGNVPRVHLQRSALERLVTPADPKELAKAARLEAIRAGTFDEKDWLPAGFTSYPMNVHNDPDRAPPFATPPGFMEGRAPAEALEEFVASRLADGHKPSDILREVGSIDFVLAHVPEAQRESYLAALEALFPLTDTSGKLRDIDQDPELAERYTRLARAHVERRHPGEADFHSQSVRPGESATRQAAYLALAEDPRTQVAFMPPGELGREEQRALRSYFYSEIAQVDGRSGRDKQRLEQELADLGPEPTKYGESLFGTEAVTPEWAEWNEKRAAILEAHGGPTAWEEFVGGMRGLKNAYEAIQEHMKGRVAERFAKYHTNLTGAPLRLGKTAVKHGERFGMATDAERRRELLAEEQSRMAGLRERVRGRFAAEGEGSVVEKLRERLKQEAAFGQSERALFAPAPADDKLEPPKVTDPFKERYSLGTRAEGELASILPYARGGLEPGDQGLRIYPEVTMGKGTRFVRQQRAIKFAKEAGKSLMAMGMGSGKTNVQIGTFTELHHERKVNKGLFVVPSVVRDQFGEEMARFTEPGRYRWHARNDPFEERMRAYRDPDTHMVVVTHQTFRDDMLRVMATHQGYPDTDDMQRHFENASPLERRRLLRNALKANGMDALLDYVAMDEAHEALGREGKPDSFLQMVTDATIQESKYAVAATGTPVKNDACIHPDTLIADPVRGIERTVREWKERREAPWVWTLDEAGNPRVAQASIPFVKARAEMYEVVTDNGRRVCVAKNHRFLTPAGWQHLARLRPGDKIACAPQKFFASSPQSGDNPSLYEPGASLLSAQEIVSEDLPVVPQKSFALSLRRAFVHVPRRLSSASFLRNGAYQDVPFAVSKRALGLLLTISILNGVGSYAGRWIQRALGCLDRYLLGSRPCDGRLRAALTSGQVSFPSPAGALERIRQSSHGDAWGTSPTHTLPETDSVPPSNVDARARYGSRTATPAFGCMGSCALGSTSELWSTTPLAPDPSARGSSPAPPSLEFLRRADQGCPQSLPENEVSVAYHKIEKISLLTIDDVYDLTVPGTHNYLAQGIWHHNSEAHDWLRKLDPDRWEGKADEFKRRYGVNLTVAADAFKREAGRYIYATAIPSGVHRKEVWGVEDESGTSRPLQLSDAQKARLEAVNTAFERARQARREGRVNLEALKILSPESFARAPEGEHAAIAERLSRSIGTLRFAAQARAIDAAPAQENAKIQHVLKLARERRERGEPGVVFAHSLAAVNEIAKALEADGHRVAVVTGADSSDEKARKRRMFHPDQGKPEADVLVMSDAGAVGMNLQRGRWLINYDVPLTYKTLAQRNARIDRIGQTADVEVHNLVTDSKFDTDAVRRVQRKGLLQDIFESDWEAMDDSGLAKYIALARATQNEPMAA